MPNKTLLSKELIDHIKKDFNSYDSFIDELNFSLINAKEFSFIVFGYNKFLNRLFINEIENYFEYSSIDFIPLLVIDVFSHSYKNDKKEYIRNLFYILDFNIVNDRYNKIYML
jgi:superoxide dismutase